LINKKLKSIFLLGSFAFCLSANALDYTYISFFENNKVRSTAELLKMQGIEKDFLTPYHCTVLKDELFGLDLIQNPLRDSLNIITSKNKVLTFKDGLSSNDKFAKKVIVAIEKIRESSSGRILIERMMKSPYPLWIKAGGNRFDPRSFEERPMFGINKAGALSSFITNRLQVDRISFNQFGSGGFVNWDSKKEYSAMESDGKVRGTPTHIALGHELYHAYDSIRGLLDRRMIKGEGLEFQPAIEYRAVYMENLLRRDAGRLYRKYYSPPSKSVQGSMLDSKGRPIFLPTDCYISH
tara:strand:+ start:22118 stop:23002 length:885 start_codon:yes stop_codon:yes gene_type:complete